MSDTDFLVVSALNDAYAACSDDFAAAAADLAAMFADKTDHDLVPEIMLCVAEKLANGDANAVCCYIMLLSASGRLDLAVAAGDCSLDLGCDHEEVIIALGYAIQRIDRSRGKLLLRAPNLLQRLDKSSRSSKYSENLANLYRDAGCAFLCEATLCTAIRRGHTGLTLRLAEHYIVIYEWRSARDLLASTQSELTDGYAIYLLGRCAVSLLIEDEVFQCIGRLLSLREPGPRYAQLLNDLWLWRVSNVDDDGTIAVEQPLRLLAARDAGAMPAKRDASVTQAPMQAKPHWRAIRQYYPVPNVLGIGAQRTGTTWLWTQLGQRRDVQQPLYKEPCYFSDFAHFASSQPSAASYWEGPTRNLLRYLAFFDDPNRARIDISPTYSELPDETVSVVRDLLGPNLRVLFCVRDPVERAWSNLKFDLELEGIDIDALNFEQRKQHYTSKSSRRRGEYTTILGRWRRHFDHVKVIFYDDIQMRPDALLHDVETYLNLPAIDRKDLVIRANDTRNIDMPQADRAFLLGLNQENYDACEAELRGPALNWRSRQLGLLQ